MKEETTTNYTDEKAWFIEFLPIRTVHLDIIKVLFIHQLMY